MHRRKADEKVAEHPIKDFADYLKNSRILMNISFEELARYSRINKSHLRGIEDGDIDEYLNKTYARGFIKAYADCIGMDVDDTLSRYNFALQRYYEQNKMNILKRYRRHLFFGFIILILAVALIIYFSYGDKDKPFAENNAHADFHEEKNLVDESPPAVDIERHEHGEDIDSTRGIAMQLEEQSLTICAHNTVVFSVTDEKGIISEEILMKNNCKTIFFAEYIIFSITDISNVTVEHNFNDITDCLLQVSDNNVLINYKLN